MYPDIGLNCILLLSVFCVFNLYILSLTMQGSCAIKGTVHFVWRIMHADDVPLCCVYIKMSMEIVQTTLRNLPVLFSHRHTVNVSKRVMDSTLIQCAFEYIHIILLLHISPPHWDIWKESMIYTKTLIIIHCMLINSEFLHLPCGRPRVLEMQPFQSS